MNNTNYGTPRKVDDIRLDFPAAFENYECFVFDRRLRFAYRAVQKVLGLSVYSVAAKYRWPKRVTARRFIVSIMEECHPNAGIVLLGSSVCRDHATIIRYQMINKEEKGNVIWDTYSPKLREEFYRIMEAEDFDLAIESEFISVEEMKKLMRKMFGVNLNTRTSRRVRRGRSERRYPKKKDSMGCTPKPRKSKVKKVLVYRSHS